MAIIWSADLCYFDPIFGYNLIDRFLLLQITIQSDGDPIDHDEALAQAIQEATAMNPDFTVEKIEINQTTQDD